MCLSRNNSVFVDISLNPTMKEEENDSEGGRIIKWRIKEGRSWGAYNCLNQQWRQSRCWRWWWWWGIPTFKYEETSFKRKEDCKSYWRIWRWIFIKKKEISFKRLKMIWCIVEEPHLSQVSKEYTNVALFVDLLSLYDAIKSIDAMK